MVKKEVSKWTKFLFFMQTPLRLVKKKKKKSLRIHKRKDTAAAAATTAAAVNVATKAGLHYNCNHRLNGVDGGQQA